MKMAEAKNEAEAEIQCSQNRTIFKSHKKVPLHHPEIFYSLGKEIAAKHFVGQEYLEFWGWGRLHLQQ